MKLAAFISSLFILFSISSAQQMGSFTDPRDGKTYKTVEIGSYTWMAENLNHKVADSFCYGKKESNCQKYGRLYSGPNEDLCPQGWRIPSYDEWENLEEAIGGTEIMGQMLKSTKGWKNGGNGSDSFGFNALPAGILSYEGTSARLGETTCFMSSEVNPNATVNEWCFDYNENGLTFGSMDLLYGGGASVRCVKDTPPNAVFQQETAGIGDYEEEDEVDSFFDPRDGKTYKTVKIGNNIWMTENLNYEIGNSWCFENDPYNCTYYGRLYQWEDALNACPDGWNLPSKEDYAIFETDKDETNRFKVYGSKLFLWSSTDKNNSNAYILRLDDDGASIRDIDKTKGISVRCIKRGRGVLKIIPALSTKSTEAAFKAFCDKAANHTNELDSLKGFGKSQFGERRGKANGGFNEGFAAGGSGIRNLLPDFGGGGGGRSAIGGKGTKGGAGAVKAPSDRDISVSGSRSKADIMKVVKQRTPGLRHIYNKSLKTKPGFSGNVTLRFTIGPKGDIISISIASSTTGYAEFDNQIKAAFSKWNFGPVQSGNTTVTLPFSFEELP